MEASSWIRSKSHDSKSQLTALGIVKGQGKPQCCLEQVEIFFSPNQQSLKGISGLKSASVPGWDLPSEAGIILSGALRRGSTQLYVRPSSHTVPMSRMPATGHLPTRAPEIANHKTGSQPP